MIYALTRESGVAIDCPMRKRTAFLMVFLLPALLIGTPALSQAASYTFGIIGDTGHWNEKTEATRDSMAKLGVKLLVLAGDNLHEDKESSFFGKRA